MGLSCQHNSMWVTFICKTFHCMKMFYLISKSSIIFCPWQSIVHHRVQRVISYEINQGGRRQNKILDVGVTHRVSGSAEPAFQDQPSQDFLGHSWVSRCTGREAAIHLLHGLRLDAAAAQGQSRGSGKLRVFEYLKHKISHLGAPTTLLRGSICLPEPHSGWVENDCFYPWGIKKRVCVYISAN